MRVMVAALVLATALTACSPRKYEAQERFAVCPTSGHALVSTKGELGTYEYYDWGPGFNGQIKFRPHDPSDTTHHAFMAVSGFDPDKLNLSNAPCKWVVGRVID